VLEFANTLHSASLGIFHTHLFDLWKWRLHRRFYVTVPRVFSVSSLLTPLLAIYVAGYISFAVPALPFENTFHFIGFQVFTSVTMTNVVFWDVKPCGFITNRRFGGTCRLNLKAEEIIRARKGVSLLSSTSHSFTQPNSFSRSVCPRKAITLQTVLHISIAILSCLLWSVFFLIPLIWSPLWTTGQSSWLQIQRSGFDSQRYQIFWEVVGLQRGSLSLVSTIEELLEWKSSGSCLEILNYSGRDPPRWHATPSIHKRWH
jgi:hypothetical protein